MLPIMPSSHLIEPQEAISHAVERLLALPEESSRRIFLEQNPQLQLQDMVLYLATQVPKIARDKPDRAPRIAGLAGWLAEILDDDCSLGAGCLNLSLAMQSFKGMNMPH